ncbi:RNA methyltransferas-like protein [Calycina marina]|uniref:rRNA methyltransferase 1, mitochondrial n=1 Tax=Calycina marina TaxID=1763456 RepID=A0A9P7Z3I3_9HELO|nr:RNA methyltransferas-like protein [Calycina marina]
MSIIVLSRGLRNPSTGIALRPLQYPALQTTRAASLTRAIGRGIRRSKGVGFRGKERDRDGKVASNGGGRSLKASNENSGVVRKHAGPPAAVTNKPMSHKGWEGPIRESSKSFGRDGGSIGSPRSPRDGPTRIWMGKRILKERKAGFREPEKHAFGKRSNARKQVNLPSRQEYGFGIDRIINGAHERSVREDGGTQFTFRGRGERQQVDKKDLDGAMAEHTGTFNSYDPRTQTRDTMPKNTPGKGMKEPLSAAGPKISFGSGPPTNYGDRGSFHERAINYRDRYGRLDKITKPENRRDNQVQPSIDRESRHDYIPRVSERPTRSNDRSSALSRSHGNFDQPRAISTFDKRIPISIPYTTPASEFLYGASVVEAALKSTREHRRKLYKLYIYSGENRENAEQDKALERLARKHKVEIAHVSGDWLRAMDKMSNSRPHNGYILESSPLPRLPVVSLAEVGENLTGFEVVLDHQSKEEAAVNGSHGTITLPKNALGRKPFVLFLDSILDPGNLGGIIRTASFLGVTAIAISKNCAAISPIVLKASAGASEDIEIFTVNKPAGFIANSKLAGWKVYAAVAPGGDGPPGPPSTATDNLNDPLAEDPCILMLGNEGEGLRYNLKTKADVNLMIRGGGTSNNVDSLNVSVATGILCDAFLRTPKTKKISVIADPKPEEPEVVAGDLF